jgi:hypothetical protein
LFTCFGYSDLGLSNERAPEGDCGCGRDIVLQVLLTDRLTSTWSRILLRMAARTDPVPESMRRHPLEHEAVLSLPGQRHLRAQGENHGGHPGGDQGLPDGHCCFYMDSEGWDAWKLIYSLFGMTT